MTAAIGDTAAGVVGAGSTAGVLTAAAAGATVANAACATTGVVARAVSVLTELAGRASCELLTTGAGDAVCADGPASTDGAEPRSAASPAPLWAAAVGINGAVAADVTALEVLAEPLPLDEVAGALVAGESALLAFAVVPPELLTDNDGPGWVPRMAAAVPEMAPEAVPFCDAPSGPADAPLVVAGPGWLGDPPAEFSPLVSARATP